MSTRRQVVRFLVSGVGATLVDLGTYLALVHLVFGGDGHDTAKTLSFVVGTCVAFLLNKFWTFESKGWEAGQAARFVALYLASMGLNVTVNHTLLDRLGEAGWATGVAFVGATGCSMVTNFIGQRWWVFRHASG